MVRFACWSSVPQAQHSEEELVEVGINAHQETRAGFALLSSKPAPVICSVDRPSLPLPRGKAGWWILPKVVNLLTIGCKSMHMETNREAENQLLRYKDIIATHKQKESPLADCKCYFNTLGLLNFLWPSAKWSFSFEALNQVVCCCCSCCYSFFPSFTLLSKMSSWQIHQAIVPFIQPDLGECTSLFKFWALHFLKWV